MLILLDHSAPAPLRKALTGHAVVEAFERGWQRLTNGGLLKAAEADGFDILITADKNIRYQQNLSHRRIALIVLSNAQWPVLRRYTSKVMEAVSAATPGSFVEVQIPYD